jgi:hypothetical protein
MLRDRRAYNDFPIRTAAYSSQAAEGSRLKVVAIVEPVSRSERIGAAAFGLFDPKGRLVAQWTAGERELATVPVTAAGLASPGTYTLRAAAIDASGRRGAAEYAVDVRLTPAEPLQLSALVLGVGRAGSFTPKVQFTVEPTALGYFEIYGTASGELSVALEVATSMDGRALSRVPAAVVPGPPGSAATRIGTGVVPVATLAPGNYVVRAIVSLDGRPIGRTYRSFRRQLVN